MSRKPQTSGSPLSPDLPPSGKQSESPFQGDGKSVGKDELEKKIRGLQAYCGQLEESLFGSRVAVLSIDRQLRLERVSSEISLYLNVGDEDIGKDIREIGSLNGITGFSDAVDSVARGREDGLETNFKTIDGRTLECRISARFGLDQDPVGVLFVVRNSSEKRDLAKRLERSERQRSELSHFGRRALGETSVSNLMNAAVIVAKDLLEADYSKILLLSEDRSEFSLVAGSGWDEGVVGNCVLKAEDYTRDGFALKTSSPVVVVDYGKDTRLTIPKFLKDHGVVSGGSVVIGSGERVFGVLGVHAKRALAFREDDLDFLQGLANALAEAMKRREDQLSLEQSEFRFRTLADNMAQLAWTADSKGWIYWYNERWYEYTGTTLDEMQGWGWQKVHHPDHVDRVSEKIQRHYDSGEMWEDTFPLRGKDGEYRWFLSRAMPIKDGDGNIIMWFGTNTDIEDRRRIEETLRQSDEMKDQFLATLAHELRNPLASIKMSADLIQIENLPDHDRKECGEVITGQAEQLIRLVDDLLDISRVSRGKIKLRKETLDLQSILQESIASVKPLLEENHQRVLINVPKELIHVEGDKTRLTQVFANLLSNAARYSDAPGEVTVEASIQSDDTVVVTVRDQGIGISEDAISRIFDLFAQGPDANQSSQAGLGIGLTLVKSLVEMHRGSVRAESAGEGRGSCFYITLPIVAAGVETGEKEEDSESHVRSFKKILIIDDNKSAADMTAKFLRYMGQEVKVAYRALDGLEIGETYRPDIVLMDVGMPEVDGIQAAGMLRTKEWGKTVKLAATTGWGQEKDRERTAAAGFDLHLVKPVDQATLLSLLK